MTSGLAFLAKRTTCSTDGVVQNRLLVNMGDDEHIGGVESSFETGLVFAVGNGISRLFRRFPGWRSRVRTT